MRTLPALKSGQGLSLALVLAALPAAAQESIGGEVAKEAAPINELHARLDLAQIYGGDSTATNYQFFTDLRLRADATALAGLPLSAHLDSRARQYWQPQDLASCDKTLNCEATKLTPTEAFLRIGEDSNRWRVALGRQLVRAVASAEVDGIAVERQLSEETYALVFAGLQLTNPYTGEFNTDFRTAGAGYERRSLTSSSSGGLVATLSNTSLDRLYLTERAYAVLSPTLMAAGFAMVDLAAPQGLFGGPVDLTNANAMLRWRPLRAYDSSLSLSHVHTILPSRWWHDWFTEQQRLRGFTIDGEEAVGTRITSLRWTNTLNLTPNAVPYLRLRYDVRHTEQAQGYEGKLGFKWRPKVGYLDVSYTQRSYFNAQIKLGSARLGLENKAVGFEGGAAFLHTQPLSAAAVATNSVDLDGVLWLELGELTSAKGLRAVMQYQAFIDPGSVYHTVFVQLGYRI